MSCRVDATVRRLNVRDQVSSPEGARMSYAKSAGQLDTWGIPALLRYRRDRGGAEPSQALKAAFFQN